MSTREIHQLHEQDWYLVGTLELQKVGLLVLVDLPSTQY